ncbi:hypothetical protein ACROYT_G013521 [Oculina patagonica]
MRRERRLSRRKEKKKVRQQFVKNPYKFAKGLFVESKSGKLECAKEELENHLKATYSDPKREDKLPRMAGLQKPTSPGVAFDMSDIKMKEVDDFVRKARAKSAPGNDGISYKVYKKCPLLRNHLFRLLHEMWRKKSVVDRWCFAEGIYLPKEENAKGIAQFRPISLLNIDANAYGSVPHGLIEMAMENFWFPEPVKAMLMQYYNKFRMRFTTDGFTTNWQRLEVGIAAGCTISVILFVLVMEMILKSTKADIALLRTPLRAFMDDITVLAKSTNAANQILERLDELITWSRMKFKAKKARSCSFVKGKQKEIRFSVAGDTIPTVREQPVKSLGRWYKGTLTDRHQGVETLKQAEEGLKAIDKTRLPGKFKVWCLQFGLYPRLMWPLMMYEVAASRVERIEQRCSVYIRKWLGLPRQLNNTALYGKGGQLELPLASICEEYKAGKVRTVMILRYSKDQGIREEPPEVRTGKKWNAEEEVDKAMSSLKHGDIVGAVQSDRRGLGTYNFKPFCKSSAKERRDAVVNEVKRVECERRYVHLVQCSQQGQCLRWEELVIGRKLERLERAVGMGTGATELLS